MSLKQPGPKKPSVIDGKTRNASEGPWIAVERFEAFIEFCERNGHPTREHPDPWITAKQIFHNGHWMAVIWNKRFMRYTADRRLSLVVQSFANDKHTGAA